MKIKVTLKNGEVIEVLPGEVEGLRKAGLIADGVSDSLTLDPQTEVEEQPGKEEHYEEEPIKHEKKPAYKLPVLTTKERRDRIKQAKKLKRQGYSQREIGRRINVSHVAVGKWLKK